MAADDLHVLLAFAHVQYSRTEMAIRRRRMVQERLHGAIFEGRPVKPEELDVSDRAMMLSSMQTCLETRHYVEDLRACIIKNETTTDFVTSDDPSIFTSRYHLQRLGRDNFGVASSGALFFLPLTPRLALMSYDGLVYTVPEKQGAYVSVASEQDASALNELQYIKAASNVYFSNWDERERVERDFAVASGRRPES